MFGMIRVIAVCLFHEITIFLERILKLFGMEKQYIVVSNYLIFYPPNCIRPTPIKYLYDRAVPLYVSAVLGVAGAMLVHRVRFNIYPLTVEKISSKIPKNVYYETAVSFKFYFQLIPTPI